MAPAAPTFTVATAKTPDPVSPGIVTIPSLLIVALTATISGIGNVEADSSSVLTPTITGAGSVFVQSNWSRATSSKIAELGINAIKNVYPAPDSMSTAVFGVPMGSFVIGSVV